MENRNIRKSIRKTLVEISLSLQHIAGHIQAATPILDRELGIAEDQKEDAQDSELIANN